MPPREPANGCARFLYWELHYSRFWLTYRDWKAFAFSPWLRSEFRCQLFYLIFRWGMAAYFFVWLVLTGLRFGPKFFIFLTHWCYLMWNTYLIVSAVSATVKVALVYLHPSHAGDGATRTTLLESPRPHIDVDVPVGCCGREGDTTNWYHKIQWVLFYLGVHMAVVVSILYWTLLYSGGPVDNINAHLVNGIIALIDVVFSGVPVRILHFIYPAMFATAYAVFTGIYFAAGGTHPNGNPYIYPVIDYGNRPGLAVGLVVAVVLVMIPIINLMIFGLYSVRFWLTHCLWTRRESRGDGAITEIV